MIELKTGESESLDNLISLLKTAKATLLTAWELLLSSG